MKHISRYDIAFEQGNAAFHDGIPRSANPYRHKETYHSERLDASVEEVA